MRLGFVTGFGLILALVASVGVAGAAYTTGGEIFSPGPLNSVSGDGPMGGVANHAELTCSDCHTPFWGNEYMGDRCLACHTEIDAEMAESASLHGELAQPSNCRTCHGEHQGPDAHLTRYDAELYPHAEFGFYLIAHRYRSSGEAFQCNDCHTQSLRTFEVGTCGLCHLDLDKAFVAEHLLDFDTGCLDCHDGIDNYGSEFSHQSTDFPLEGAHLTLACRDCHAGAKALANLQETDSACINCHGDDDVHAGRLGDDCAACHTAADWKVAEFDHALTGFPLVEKHSQLACADCHNEHAWEEISQSCISCHAKDDVHKGQLGTDCVACHNAADWSQVLAENFDHNLTRYPLTGKHASLATCESCHIGGQLKGTPTQCVACHRADDAHSGQYGLDCAGCHNTSSWKDATFDHNQTRFKLTGSHTALACTNCHQDGRYQGTPSQCVDCHRDDDAHNGQYGVNCSACHSTAKWQGASFDHALTAFPLTGLHKNAVCESCHTNGQYAGTPKTCVSCHQSDDAHNGAYGSNCASCHTTGGWQGASFDHAQTAFPLTGLHKNVVCESCHTNGQYAGTPKTCVSCHQADDAHNGAYGTNCASCHTPGGWQGASFDHAQTAFPLTGLHKNVVCESCHTNGQYAGTPKTCVSCHQVDDAHNGAFGTNCAGCHTTSGWQGASFDHNQTAFPLTGLHKSVACETCHVSGQYAGTPKTCVSCHQADDAHNGAFGTNCAGCHTTSGWQGASFDHNQTAFRLTGAHINAACSACHVNGQYAGTPTSCVSCHADPAYHAGLFGTDCQACHTTSAWRPATYNRSHSFPMNHGNAGSKCSSCHNNPLPQYACTKCHAHDPQRMADKHAEKGITDLSNCLACHPNGKKD